MKWWPLLALIVSPLVSAVTLDELQQRFTGQPVVRAHFEQVRTIKDMPQPLRSQGEMLIARDSGLLWDQKAPFPMTLLLDDKRMVQAINGQPPQTVTADNNPQMFQFNHLLRALFQADDRATAISSAARRASASGTAAPPRSRAASVTPSAAAVTTASRPSRSPAASTGTMAG